MKVRTWIHASYINYIFTLLFIIVNKAQKTAYTIQTIGMLADITQYYILRVFQTGHGCRRGICDNQNLKGK